MKTISVSSGRAKAIVDDDDFATLSAHSWWLAGSRLQYAYTQIKKKTVYMHQLVLPKIKGKETDHRDGNPLNNQRDNLRYASVWQNRSNRKKAVNNTSGAKGVSFNKRRKSWVAFIFHNGKNIHIGDFHDVKSAQLARQALEIKLKGEFACLD